VSSGVLARLRRCVATEGGEIVPIAHLVNAPRSLASAVRRKTRGKFDEVPFIPYCASQAIESRLQPESVVVEVGAGNSTIWLAKRSRHVSSMEWDSKWLAFVERRLKELGLPADVRLMHDHEEVHFDWIMDGSVDVVIVDGGPRPQCFRNLWPKLKPGGLAYLDNWDNARFWTEGFDAHAELANIVGDSRTTECVDYVPGMFCVDVGLVIEKSSK
jgi:hypothetical protein